jgi:DNA replication protein DnaC
VETYEGQDGLMYCAVCGEPLQGRIKCEPLGIDMVVNCKCKCDTSTEEFEAQMKAEEIDRKRKACFAQTNMAGWTFEKDDRQNPKISDAMKRYADNFKEFKKEGQGLLLYGTVGTGKTYMAASIANAIIDNGHKAYMTNFEELAKLIFDGKAPNLSSYELLVIDDLGAERKSDYMQGQVYNIIDNRYRSGLPLIVTTNLDINEIKNPSNIGYARIYDRILEKCFPVEVVGISRRRKNVRDNFQQTKSKLGL